MSRRRAFLACAASAVLAHSLVHRCSGTPTEEIVPLSHELSQEQAPAVDVPAAGELRKQISGSSALPEGKNPASQVASLNQGNQVQAPEFLKTANGEIEEQTSRELPSEEVKTDDAAPSRRLQSSVETNDFKHEEVFLPYPFNAAARRRLEGALSTVVDTQELLSEHVFPHNVAPPRRLQLFGGLSQLAQPFSAVTSLFGSGFSSRDKDQLETFSRRVATSRERVYKDLLFVTGGKHQGLDEYAMKQLVAKVGLENLSTGNVPSSIQLSRQESLVLEAAKRSRFQVDRIIATYEREVTQHLKTLRQEMQADTNSQAVRGKVESIIAEGLFKRQTLSVRRLQQAPRLRRLAGLLQGPGLLGTAGSLFHSMDPSNLTNSINASLGGLGLHHLHVPNIGAFGFRHDGHAAVLPLGDISGLQQALESIFPVRQQATALSGPLRSFQQGVSTATDGAIGAFLSKEGLLPFLSVDSAKHLLGSLIGGEAIAPHGASGWDDLGLSPEAAQGLAGIMSFDTFLTKLGLLAQEVDEDVGTLKRETKKRIGAEGFPLLPEQLLQVDGLLDRLVWGSFQAPVRRLQEVENAPEMQPQHQPQQQPQQQQQFPNLQQEVASQQALQTQQHAPQTQQQAPSLQQLGSQTQQPTPQTQQPTPQTQQPTPQTQQPTPQTQQPTPQTQHQATQTQHQATQTQHQATQTQQQVPPVQQPAVDAQVQTEVRKPGDVEQQEETGEQQEEDLMQEEVDASKGLFEALLSEEASADDTPEEQIDSALQRIELLVDAVTVLLREYEKAVEHLQTLLDDQIEAAEEIRDELQEQAKEMKRQVTNAQQKQQGAAATAAKEVAKAYDEAMVGIKGSLEDVLQQEAQQEQGVASAVQQELASLAAKIEAAAEEHLPTPVALH